MQRSTRYGVFFAALAAMTLFAVAFRKHPTDPSSPSPRIHDWDIAQLATNLNRLGVQLHLRAVPKNNQLSQSAFLTSTAKEWADLNALIRDPRTIEEWRGTLYCERVSENGAKYLLEQGGDYCMLISPFYFFGDAELLNRVRNALAPFASPGTI
jgi:hypothetical protein